MSGKPVKYERVNIDDIDTSSDDDDYGDLFANERGRIVKGRPKFHSRKGGKNKTSNCCYGVWIFLFIFLLLLAMAGVAIYLDPEDSLEVIKDYIDKNSTTSGVIALVDDNHDTTDSYNTTVVAEEVYQNATEEGNLTITETTVTSKTMLSTESSVIGDKDNYDQLLNLKRSDSWTSSMDSSSTFDQYSYK